MCTLGWCRTAPRASARSVCPPASSGSAARARPKRRRVRSAPYRGRSRRSRRTGTGPGSRYSLRRRSLAAAPTADRLQTATCRGWPIAPGSLTVSGISAGGYMAGQFHVAHSARRSPAPPSLPPALTLCRGLGAPGTRPLHGRGALGTGRSAGRTRRDELAQAGRIDPVSGLAGDRVWLFHGARDAGDRRPASWTRSIPTIGRSLRRRNRNPRRPSGGGAHLPDARVGGAMRGVDPRPTLAPADTTLPARCSSAPVR